MVFRETQQVREMWVIALVVVIALGPWIALLRTITSGGPNVRSRLPSVGFLVIFLVFGVALPSMLFSMNLITEVRTDGVCLKYVPFHRTFRCFAYSEIATINVRTYRPVAEYGGWGLRSGRAGRAYNVSGDQGLQIVMKTGDRILIGTQQPEALMRTVASVAPQLKGS
jgi:hypothetical protein